MNLLALLLADSRLPTGSHAHSGGTEQAVDEGLVRDVATLRDWLEGRLATTIALDAFAAAAACALVIDHRDEAAYSALDDEIDARIASPAARYTSRRQGSQYQRTAIAILGPASFETLHRACAVPHLSVAVGVAAGAAGLAPADGAAIALYQSVAGASAAALRLTGLDPVAIATLVADLAPRCDAISARATAAARDDPSRLPAVQAPALDRLMEIHRAREERLFAS